MKTIADGHWIRVDKIAIINIIETIEVKLILINLSLCQIVRLRYNALTIQSLSKTHHPSSQKSYESTELEKQGGFRNS